MSERRIDRIVRTADDTPPDDGKLPQSRDDRDGAVLDREAEDDDNGRAAHDKESVPRG